MATAEKPSNSQDKKIDTKKLDGISKAYFDELYSRIDRINESTQKSEKWRAMIRSTEKWVISFEITKIDTWATKIVFVDKVYESKNLKENSIFLQWNEQLHLILEYDKKTGTFKYLSDNYTLPQKNYKTPSGSIISNERAITIMQNILAEIDAAETGWEIGKKTSIYIEDLKSDMDKNK